MKEFISQEEVIPIYTKKENTTSGDYSASLCFASRKTGEGSDKDIERMRIDSNGNVGIGITTPRTHLDVRGAVNTAASSIQIVGDTVSTLLLGQNSDGGVIRGQGGENALTFWTGGLGDTGAGQSGTERMRIDSTVNVGSGT